MKTKFLILLVAIAARGCMDINLLDEMELEGETDSQDTQDSDNGSDSDSDQDSDGPPNTDPNDETPPVLIGITCELSEQMQKNICIAQGNGSASLRFGTDEPAEVQIAVSVKNPAKVFSVPWSTEHHVVVVDLGEKETPFNLEVFDVNGNKAAFTSNITGLIGPQVAITEILADPFGPEPDQEFIEIANFGSAEIDLSGWMIDDNKDANGDLIPNGTLLTAGRVAVIVSQNFNSAEGSDPSPDPSALLITLPSSLCSSGLKNSKVESVELYDSSGTLISAYDRGGATSEGQSISRITAEAPDGDPLAFDPSQPGAPTPGATVTVK